MDRTPNYYPDPRDQLTGFVERGMRLARRAGISFALAVIGAIVVGAAATDNGFVQLLITAFAAVALWLPAFFLLGSMERLFTRRPRAAAPVVDATASAVPSDDDSDRAWRRLALAAPGHADRIAVLRRSIDRSRVSLGEAKLDVDAHEVCSLIDRRLPQLIDKELDDLPPDDRDRSRQIDELVNLIEQFARDCSRRNSDNAPVDRYGAEVLRRRFEAHLSNF
ncbi:hypothetical protein H9L12_13070 [Sphingomonas rhizophila]|uniref:Uncharacterized protein n=1 Tax=Sphingomonas rhizophila TaxID=2071607 RepID=A0A7G9SB64_9SPHN|nr:hypothetical protein [Sphingomonas rhizophila]QNN65089.1 hypothetical protein H9L12_13070 [Sphingomonas rhizophila]